MPAWVHTAGCGPPVLGPRLQALVGTSWLVWVSLWDTVTLPVLESGSLLAPAERLICNLDYPPVDNRDMNVESNRGGMDSMRKKEPILSCQS